jgi:hypothetical protein
MSRLSSELFDGPSTDVRTAGQAISGTRRDRWGDPPIEPIARNGAVVRQIDTSHAVSFAIDSG